VPENNLSTNVDEKEKSSLLFCSMKNLGILILTTVLVTGCNEQHTSKENFTSKRITKSTSFIINETIDKVFPLYGAFEERKWIPTWKPILIYPDKEIIEEGTTFKLDVSGHRHGSESEYLWIVTKYEPKNYLIQYLVSTENRFWTITVECNAIKNNSKTKTTVTYSFTGLNDKGNKINQESLERMYKNNLQDWAEAINTYFENLK